jgi:hypothetical protein
MKGRLRIVLCCGMIAVLAGTVGFVIARMVPADLPLAKVNLSGEHSAAITVTRADGLTAAGEPWTLRFLSDGNVSSIGVTYGNPRRTRQIKPSGISMDLTLSAGIVPEDGVIELRGLPGGENTQMLHLFVGRAGYLGLSLPDDAKTHESFSLKLPADLKAGDQAPIMEVVRVSDSTTTTLPRSEKVAYLEFWGVHCRPCQEPLAHLDDLARRRGKEWQSRVQLASVCLDPINDVSRHVATRSLKHVDHFIPTSDHPTGGTPNPSGVLGVPRAFLIDATGRIIWVGHPNGYDVEPEIEALLME